MKIRRCSVVCNLVEFRDVVQARMSGMGSALEYGPAGWALARIEVGGFDRRTYGRSFDPATVYEVRAFDANQEGHWVRRGESGVATWWLSADIPAPSGEVTTTEFDVVATIDHRYRLWGEVDSTDGAWTTLSDGRVGAYQVPVTGATAPRLKSVEYVINGPDGNAQVLVERLVGFGTEGG